MMEPRSSTRGEGRIAFSRIYICPERPAVDHDLSEAWIVRRFCGYNFSYNRFFFFFFVRYLRLELHV